MIKQPHPSNTPALQDTAFLALLVGVTLAFGWILLPFYGAIFWGVVLAIVFAPLFRWLMQHLGRRRNVSAFVALAVIMVIVMLPLAFVAGALVREGTLVVQKIQTGEISFARYFYQFVSVLPGWAIDALDAFGLGDTDAVQQRITESASEASKFIATRVFDIGQNTLDFVVGFFITVYLTFFLLRDGAALSRKIWEAIPIDPDSKRNFFKMFATVIRATVKGNIVVAIVQGALGGLAFWYLGVHGAVLWAVLMAFLSLLPAIGAALIWFPVALYLLVNGEVAKGVGLMIWGTVVIGVIDNLLRPVLVGKDIRMPDYLVLVSTLGGMAIFGLNGFVIGPVVAAMFLAAWEIFIEARNRKRG